ncbi:MAG: hypothetical protein WBQ86_14735 [Candidatus Binatus sp.]
MLNDLFDELSLHQKENRMPRKMSFLRGVVVLAAVMALVGIGPASAQTQGMARRNERRDDRAAARAAKQACKAGDEKSRAECRQLKREVKQAGRNDGGSNANAAPATRTAE